MTTHSVSSVSEVIMSNSAEAVQLGRLVDSWHSGCCTGKRMDAAGLTNSSREETQACPQYFMVFFFFIQIVSQYPWCCSLQLHRTDCWKYQHWKFKTAQHPPLTAFHCNALYIMVLIVIGGAWYCHTGLTQLCVDADADLSGRPVQLQRRCLCSWFWFLCCPLRSLKEQKPCLVPGLQTVAKTFCEGCFVLGMYCVVVGNVFVFSFRGSVGLIDQTDALRSLTPNASGPFMAGNSKHVKIYN